MATFTGTDNADTADAGTGTLTGFTGGTSVELMDDTGDIFIGLAGEDTIRAGSANDLLRGGLGADLLDGGLGSDTADYSDNFGSVFVNLDIGLGFNNAAEGDTYAGIENVIGTFFADFIIGDAGANRFDGAQGDDYLIGFLGPDALIGGDGFDTASYEENAGAIFINLRTGLGYGNAAHGDTFDGVEGIVGTKFDDYIIAGSTTKKFGGPTETTNRIDGGEGNDYIISGDGADVLIGGDGEDTVSFQNNVYYYSFGLDISLVDGTAFDNESQKMDTISGFENVRGSNRLDIIVGNSGDNVIAGGLGADRITGGGGRDTFVFDSQPSFFEPVNPFNNIDDITDFTSLDFIYLSQSIYNALPLGQLSSSAFLVGDAATAAEHRVIYNPENGALLYDSDGSGGAAAIHFATLQGSPEIDPSQFFVIG
jgi:Ca2+-binding RTX toxin-like protein